MRETSGNVNSVIVIAAGKRQATTKAKVTVENFDKLKATFMQDVRNVMLMNEIPSELVVNFDKTGINCLSLFMDYGQSRTEEN